MDKFKSDLRIQYYEKLYKITLGSYFEKEFEQTLVFSL